MKINWFNSEKYFFTDESVKRQITDSISANLTDSDLESTMRISWNIFKLQYKKLTLYYPMLQEDSNNIKEKCSLYAGKI